MAAKRPTGEALREAIAQRTGYVFSEVELAQRALNHASALKPGIESNERLEFVGDRVLGLLVAELLYEAYPHAPEGELSIRLNALVRAETCAAVGLEIDLLPLIRAETKVKNQSVRNANKVLADVVEALIAGIYLDGGLEAARTFVRRLWSERAGEELHTIRDPKTLLQEFTARRSKSVPAYVVESVEGPDHEPRFTVRVDVPGFAPERGEGRSKQGAQSKAAEAFLRREGLLPTGGVDA
ncbi:MAG: ribonuclease III [Rhizobiaceae bacterium]|nr:ribonuclease III [Rhizobiaceae bacterium]MCV0408056.1 ribonuclease III [Rhizobiaceae bacterium]